MLSEIAPTIDTIFEKKITPFFDIIIDNKLCTMCDACSNICSVDALKSIQLESSIELTFRSRKCVGCYACVKVCPEICIDIKRRFIPKNIIEDKKEVKIKDSISICKKCGEPIGYYKKIKNIEKILSHTKNTNLLKALYLCKKCKSPLKK
ncbi:ATP-binding protein [Thermoproteota archaeon]